MNLLIIGGLLAVALLAVLGAVFLSISEQRAEKARADDGTILSSISPRPMVEQPPTVSRAEVQTAPIRQSMPIKAERPLRTTEESQQPHTLNGQFHELAIELRTLYQHAWELEHRLRMLTEIADRIEETQSNQVSIEEEIHSQPSADSTT